MSEQNMSPEASPGSVKTGTRRVNNMPLMIIGAVAMVFLMVLLAVGVQRAAQQQAALDAPAQKTKATNSTTLAQAIVAGRPEAVVQPRSDQPPAIPPVDTPASTAAPSPASGAVGIVRPTNLDAPPPPPGRQMGVPQGMANGPMQPQDDGQRERLRQVKEQMFLDAVKARPTVQFDPARGSGSSGPSYVPPSSSTSGPMSRDEMLNRLADVRRQLANVGKDDPTAAYKQRLAQLQASGLVPVSANIGGGAATAGGAGGGGMGAAMSTAAGASSRDAGSSAQSGDRFRLNAEVQAPESPFELRAPALIPAVLISGINSELKGPIFAQVSQDVFDSATHKYMLIPQGSKLYGEYDSQVAYGQSRVLVAWNRIVFPDGKTLDIGSMPGVDSSGYSGFNDQVNNHYVRIFTSAVLLSGITAGVALSTNQNQTSSVYGTQQSTSSTISQALGQQLGQVSAQLIQKNMNISPTLEIRPGYRFNIVVVKDLVFSKPYQAFDY
ncbi:TrbI/VirB10 family protein [Burkholderia aenigmatica]|uniref:TrbI/VirB10 family protein n=1 Tax=Burkholderia aenigmatica TaxID=2015348 RepID=UPI00264E9D11|nr:TrbI/VirB10 family protein [Burkholderia aenigmatica]MDN7880116.1 TrbI/VirB10 family protein [Burkholderia aenigmatica]